MSTMWISQLAERTGVPATTLRFYESAGLLPAERSRGGYRLYGEDAAERLAFIGAAKRLGLPLEEIAELLAVWESRPCTEVKADLRPRLAERIADAEQRAAEVVAFTATLHRARERLDALPDRDTPCDPQCTFLAPAVPTLALRDAAGQGGVEDGEEGWRTAAVACSLSGDQAADRAGQWRQVLSGARREEVESGLRLTLPTERAGDIAALAAAEQYCCPFFDFRLHLDGPVLHLEVRAPGAGTEMLVELFATA